jgi:hypothetical protein
MAGTRNRSYAAALSPSSCQPEAGSVTVGIGYLREIDKARRYG